MVSLVLGCELFFDAFAHPLTADAGQLITGIGVSVFLDAIGFRCKYADGASDHELTHCSSIKRAELRANIFLLGFAGGVVRAPQ